MNSQPLKSYKYRGADWVKQAYPMRQMSEFGEKVANLLGYLFAGIYHMDRKELDFIDWSGEHHIEVILRWNSLSTFDFDDLTKLVLLAHRMAIRVDVSPRSAHSLTILFHPRSRQGDFSEFHPTIHWAIERFDKECDLPEVN